jgi:hypothetical protein
VRVLSPFDISFLPTAPFSVTARCKEPGLIIKRVVMAPDGNQLELVMRTDTEEEHIYSYGPAEVEGVKLVVEESA